VAPQQRLARHGTASRLPHLGSGGTGFGLIFHASFFPELFVMEAERLAAEQCWLRTTEPPPSAGGDGARAAVESSLGCAICLSVIDCFEEAACMTCVCEGLFHRRCLERLPQGAEARRRCPYCRREGRILSLQQELSDEHVPTGRQEARLLALRLAKEEDGALASLLLGAEEKLARQHCRLEKELRRLGAEQGPWKLRQLLFPPPANVWARWCRGGGCGGALCCLCGAGVQDFSSLATQGCPCQALFHAACLAQLQGRTPPGRVACCPRCGSGAVLPEGAAVKELLRDRQARHGLSGEEARSRAARLQRRQERQLAWLRGQRRLVARRLTKTEVDQGQKRTSRLRAQRTSQA